MAAPGCMRFSLGLPLRLCDLGNFEMRVQDSLAVGIMGQLKHASQDRYYYFLHAMIHGMSG